MREGTFDHAAKTWLTCWFVAGVLMTFGCRSAAWLSGNHSENPITAAEFAADNARAQTTTSSFLDNPELQSGTGPIDPGQPPEFSTTSSGLKYRILRESGGQKPTADNRVTVHYRGWLGSGKVFDNSYERGEPTSFPLSNVVKGWTEGMQLVGEGGMIELWVPSKLGYGAQGSPGSIPPHSNLHFIVELLSVD